MDTFSEEMNKLGDNSSEKDVQFVQKNEPKKADLHTHLIGVDLEDGVMAAARKNLDLVAFGSYNHDNFPELQERTRKMIFSGYDPEIFQNYIVFFKSSKKPLLLLRMLEYNTSENIHLNFIGNTENVEPKMNIFKVIDQMLQRKCVVTLDHPGVDAMNPYLPINKRTEDILNRVCERYKSNIAIEFNGYCIPKIWDMLRETYKKLGKSKSFKTINKKILKLKSLRRLDDRILDKNPNEFARELASRYNIPYYASTDLHARDKELTQDIATAYVEFNGKFNGNPIESLSNNLKNKQLENHEDYVTTGHIWKAFGWHVIKGKFGYNSYKTRG